MATLKGYAIASSGTRSARIRIPRFEVSGLTQGGYIDSLNFKIPMRLSSKAEFPIGSYNVTLILCKKVAYAESETGGWYKYNYNGVSYWGTDDSSTYWIYKNHYENIIGKDNILGKPYSYSINFTEKGKNTTISFTLENLNIPTNSIDTGELGLAILYENNSAIEFASGQACTGTIIELSAPTGSFTGSVSPVANGNNNSSLTVNEPIAGYHRMKVTWSYNKTDAKTFSLIINDSSDRIVAERTVESSGTEYFDISNAGKYFVVAYAYNVPNNETYQLVQDLGSLTFYSYTINKKYTSSPVKYYTNSGAEITGNTTTASTIKAQWQSDSFQLVRNDNVTSAYGINYNLNSSNGDSFGAELSRSYTLNENSSITFNTLNAYLYDSNTNSRVGAPATYSISQVISRGTNAVASIPEITNYLTKSGKVIYSTIKLSISNSTATTAYISYFSDTNDILGSNSQSLINGSTTFTFHSPEKKLKKISFNFGDGIYFSFNGVSGTSATYTISSPKQYLLNWGITPSVTIDGSESNNKLLKNLVFKITGYDEPQSSSYHTVNFTLSQGSSSVSLGNYSLTNNYEYSLNRSNSILNNFSLGSPITFTYTINSTDNRYPINSKTNLTTGYSGNIQFSIYEAVTFDELKLSNSTIEKYSLTSWNNNGSEAYSSTQLSLQTTVPSGLTGGTYGWNIFVPDDYLNIETSSSVSGNGASIPTFTVKTKSNTPLNRISISATLTYTLNGQELLNESKEIFLTVKDSRNPYVPSLTLSFSKIYTTEGKNYFIPNYSILEIGSGLDGIETVGGTATLNFYFTTKNTSGVIIERGNVQKVTYNSSQTSYTFPSAQIPSIIFTENNEGKLTIGLRLTVTESDGRSTTRDLNSQTIPAYVATPKINSLIAGQNSSKKGTLTINYTLGAGVLAQSTNFKLKILAEMNELNGSTTSTNHSSISYSDTTGNEKIIFNNDRPENGYMNATLVMIYGDEEVSLSSSKRVGFAKEVGEIAIRKKGVGFHGEPPENHSVAIYTVSNKENAYILSFYDGGIQLGGFQVKNGADIIFSAGKWE